MDSSATELLEASEAQHERRRAPRQTFITKGMIYREDRQSGPQRIILKNLSLLGVGFECAAPIEPGTRCRIRIEAGPTQINWRLQIVCCGKIEGGNFRLGGQFVPAELERGVVEQQELRLAPAESEELFPREPRLSIAPPEPAAPEPELSIAEPQIVEAEPSSSLQSDAPAEEPDALEPLPQAPDRAPVRRRRYDQDKPEASTFFML